jgi:hypothetical protein
VTRFQFPLERVLDWRRKQLELEEARFQQAVANVATVDKARLELETGVAQAETAVREWGRVAAWELRALAEYRAHVRDEEARLAVRRAQCERAQAEHQAAMMEARRRCRLLERLRERRLAEWKAAGDRELEEIASESYLAQWGRAL